MPGNASGVDDSNAVARQASSEPDATTTNIGDPNPNYLAAATTDEKV